MNITVRDIHKHYGNVRANNGIFKDIPQGIIQGILGENGAGKSTLMKVLAGYVPKTGGIIEVDGKAVEYEGPAQANRLGIGMLYQDPLDFPSLSVLENYMIGRSTGITCQKDDERKQFLNDAEHFGFRIHPDSPVKSLTLGERQQLEIMRLLAIGGDVLILDEPTTGISSLQKTMLFDALKKLAQQQKTVLLVSHKLTDVVALCDRITVLRQGKVTGQMTLPFDTQQVLECMFGTLPEPPTCAKSETGRPLIIMKGVWAPGGAHRVA